MGRVIGQTANKLYTSNNVKSDPETFKLSCEEESPTWCVFRTRLATYKCAYGAAFVKYRIEKDNRDVSKLMFAIWLSDETTMKDKMKYASTKVMNKFGITPVKVQAGKKDDISFLEIVEEKLNRKNKK